MAGFNLLYIPPDLTVSNAILLAGKRYCIVQRRLQVHTSIVVERIVCPSRFAGRRLKGCLRLKPNMFS